MCERVKDVRLVGRGWGLGWGWRGCGWGMSISEAEAPSSDALLGWVVTLLAWTTAPSTGW